jgi:hypothetical protein
MPKTRRDSGLAAINKALIYYETAGEEEPFVMIHAGVPSDPADGCTRRPPVRSCHIRACRSGGRDSYLRNARTRYSTAGYRPMLDYLGMDQPLIAMGCSMGGGLAMDLALDRQG